MQPVWMYLLIASRNTRDVLHIIVQLHIIQGEPYTELYLIWEQEVTSTQGCRSQLGQTAELAHICQPPENVLAEKFHGVDNPGAVLYLAKDIKRLFRLADTRSGRSPS